MTSILKTDEIQSQNGGAVVKMQTLKHPSASGNNLVLGSDGNISITNTLSAGTIGSGVTITDGASPHGWEHIKTISYNSNTATPSQMANVVSSKYSAYKLIVQWGSHASGQDLYFRFLDSSGNELSNANKYEYGATRITEGGSSTNHFNGPGSEAQIGEDIYYGTRGWNGEILLYNCFASSSDFPQIDGYQLNNSGSLPASPYAMFRYTGMDVGHYDLLINGFLWYDIDPTYVSGFRLKFEGSNNVQAGSWWSCYGLKLPTAD